MIRKLFLFLLLTNFVFATKLSFKPIKMDSFELQGLGSKIVYKNKQQRNEQIAKLWEKFLTSSYMQLSKSEDGNLYVVYKNYKANSFDCFIGIKLKEKMGKFEKAVVAKSSYQEAVIKYKTGLNLESIWEEIKESKIKRDFKTDIERHKIDDILKDNYKIYIYLSSK